MKKILVLTGGGDCPGLNAVIRGITKAAAQSGEFEVWGSVMAFNGLMNEPVELMKLTSNSTSGIHVKGGTILRTTNKGNPLEYPVQQADGTWTTIDRSKELIQKAKAHGFDAVISIGGDGSQQISWSLYQAGMPIIGVPKTIDNDLSATDYTFGFNTAVQIATDCLDKLVTTAESHNRVLIMEVMGRNAGWIALYTAIAGGAEICLIPEIPYTLENVLERINSRYTDGRGFVNIVVAEGAKSIGGEIVGRKAKAIGDTHIKLGGISNYLRWELEEAGCAGQIRTTILGHIQRGGTPIAFDRILATSMGVKAFEMVESKSFGKMVALENNQLVEVPLQNAISEYNYVDPDHYLINTARKCGISFGD